LEASRKRFKDVKRFQAASRKLPRSLQGAQRPWKLLGSCLEASWKRLTSFKRLLEASEKGVGQVFRDISGTGSV
jgi:hypothetical protein